MSVSRPEKLTECVSLWAKKTNIMGERYYVCRMFVICALLATHKAKEQRTHLPGTK